MPVHSSPIIYKHVNISRDILLGGFLMGNKTTRLHRDERKQRANILRAKLHGSIFTSSTTKTAAAKTPTVPRATVSVSGRLRPAVPPRNTKCTNETLVYNSNNNEASIILSSRVPQPYSYTPQTIPVSVYSPHSEAVALAYAFIEKQAPLSIERGTKPLVRAEYEALLAMLEIANGTVNKNPRRFKEYKDMNLSELYASIRIAIFIDNTHINKTLAVV